MKTKLIAIACIIAAAVIGWFIYKFAVGIMVFMLFATGAVSGFFVAKLIYHKKEKKEPEKK